MNVKFYCLAAVAAVFSLSGCSEEKIAPPDSYMSNKIESGVSWLIPSSGGEYTITLKEEFSKWAEINQWNYRIFCNDIEIEAGVADGNSLTFDLPINYSDQYNRIIVEGLLPDISEKKPKWISLCNSEQSPVYITVNGVSWAKSNLTIKNGKFAVSENPGELGLYFKHRSLYGVLSDGDSYSGKCYTPGEKTVALADIPEKDGDPCMAASGGVMRLPSLYEIEKLFNAYDYEKKTINGVQGLSFGSGKLFFPLAGGYDMNSGAIGYKNTNGAYWYSGEDSDGLGGILVYLPDFDLQISYNYGTYTSSVRCVRNTQKPAYVSHSPATLNNSEETTIRVTTIPGDLDEYVVALVDGSYEITGTATHANPVGEIIVPANTDFDEIIYMLYVNGEPTGKKITQPGISNYGFYKSHTPTGTVPSDAFTLTINCTTDMPALDVEVKDEMGLSLKGVASKANPSAKIQVPENTGDADRVLKIYVNGKYTGRSLIQERPLGFVVVWSPGYLTVKDGAYAFAGEQELGMYFKYKSRYGLTLDSTGKKYSGDAYGPAKETKAYADVNFEDVDPCTLVAPAGTWRMPSREEWEDVLTYDFQLLMNKYRAYTDKKQTVYITPSGNINATGTSVGQPQWAKVWSTTPHVTDAGKYYYLVGTFSGETSVFNCTMGLINNQALMVRCVRDR